MATNSPIAAASGSGAPDARWRSPSSRVVPGDGRMGPVFARARLGALFRGASLSHGFRLARRLHDLRLAPPHGRPVASLDVRVREPGRGGLSRLGAGRRNGDPADAGRGGRHRGCGRPDHSSGTRLSSATGPVIKRRPKEKGGSVMTRKSLALTVLISSVLALGIAVRGEDAKKAGASTDEMRTVRA